MTDSPQTSPVSAAPAERKSLLARARAHDAAAIETMFRQFLPAGERVAGAEFLGTLGVMGLGTHTFSCVTERRVAALRVKLLGGVDYEDAALSGISSGVVRQPSRIFLYLFVAAATLLTFGLALLVLPLVVRLFYRFVKSGLVFWIADGSPVYVFSDRKLLLRANALYRLAGAGTATPARTTMADEADADPAADASTSSRQSLLSRARAHDPAALTTLFRQFLPADDRVLGAEFLGTQGVWGFGVHSFACVTDARVATLRVKLLGGFEYQDAGLGRVNSGTLYQPSRIFLYLFVAAASVVTLGVALLLLPLTARAYYRFVKSGIVFWTSAHRARRLRGLHFWAAEGIPVYVFSDRKLLLRAMSMYRAALAARAALNEPVQGRGRLALLALSSACFNSVEPPTMELVERTFGQLPITALAALTRAGAAYGTASVHSPPPCARAIRRRRRRSRARDSHAAGARTAGRAAARLAPGRTLPVLAAVASPAPSSRTLNARERSKGTP